MLKQQFAGQRHEQLLTERRSDPEAAIESLLLVQVFCDQPQAKESETRHAAVYHHKSTLNAMWSRIAFLVTHTSNIGD
jgi:hypothetical protein